MMNILEKIELKEADPDKVNTYRIMATMVPGSEEIAEKQIQEVLENCLTKKTLRGKIFFYSKASLRTLLKIGCLDNLYLSLAEFRIGAIKKNLEQFESNLKTVQYRQVLSSVCKFNSIYKIHVSVSRSGKHSFSRFDVAESASRALTSLYDFEKGEAEDYDLHFRVDVIEDMVYVSLKITSPVYRYRSDGKQFSQGAIRPSIANCLIWLSQPNKRDTFLDPFCGSGTIASERERYPHRKIFAFDNQEKAVETARNNVSEKVIVRYGDACNLSMNDKCVDVIVTNLPWDVQIRSEDIRKLYYDFLIEAFRVLKNNGRMIVLTDKMEILEEVCNDLCMSIESVAVLSLHGLHPHIIRIKRI